MNNAKIIKLKMQLPSSQSINYDMNNPYLFFSFLIYQFLSLTLDT